MTSKSSNKHPANKRHKISLGEEKTTNVTYNGG